MADNRRKTVPGPGRSGDQIYNIGDDMMRLSIYITILAVLCSAIDGSSAPTNVSSLATCKGYLIAGTFSGKIFISPDSGLRWNDVSYGLCDASGLGYQKSIKCLKVIGDDSIQAITACGKFVSAVSNVLQWEKISSDSCVMEYCPACVPNMEYTANLNSWIIAACITGPIEWSRDSGKTWTVAVPGCSTCSMSIIQCLYFDTISALAGFSQGDGSHLGFTSNIIMSTDSGRTWRATGLTGIASGISSITRMGSIAFVGAENGVYASRDNYTTWWVAGESSRCTSGAWQINGVSEKPALFLQEIRQDGKTFQKFTYDSFGRMTADNVYSNESYTYDSLGRLSKRFYTGFEETYKYDAGGALSSMTRYYPETGKTWSENYRRGSNGTIFDAITLFNGDTTGYVLYKHDCAGNTIERSEYGMNGTLFYQERCTYDSFVDPLQLSFPFDMVKKGNMVSHYYYNINMSSLPPQYSSSYEYNALGLPLRETRVQTRTNDTAHFDYVYDKPAVGTFREPLMRQTATITISGGGRRSALVVSVNLNSTALTSISLCDLSGRRVTMLLKPTAFSAGNHRIPLSFNENNVQRAGGIFLCVVKTGAVVKTFRIPVIR